MATTWAGEHHSLRDNVQPLEFKYFWVRWGGGGKKIFALGKFFVG